jgi:HEAT repeat protein
MKTFAATGIAQFIEDAPEDLDPAVKVPPLLKGLEKGDQRERALERLRSIGEDASDAIPQLLRMCDDSDLNIRFLAAQAVMSIDPFDYPKAMSTFFVTGARLRPRPTTRPSATRPL